MLKDIYSPLEIDEQWDQRAPMVEGDSSMDAMSNLAPEAGGATAVAEPSVDTTIPPAPAEPIKPEESSDIGHYGGGMISETEGSAADTEVATNTNTDDHAAELLGGETPDPEIAAAIDTEPPSETIENKTITDPVVSFTPEHPRPQPEPGDITTESTVAENADETLGDEAKTGNKPEDLDTGLDTNIVMADHHDSEHKTDTDEETSDEVTPEPITAPQISPEEHDAAGERLDAMSDVLKEVDEEVETILAKLSAEDTRLEELLTEKNTTITNTQAEVSDIEAKRAAIADKQATLAQMKQAG